MGNCALHIYILGYKLIYLALAKPENISLILEKLNSFHSQIQFTFEECVDQMTSTFWTLNLILKELPSIASQPTQDNTVITRVSLHGHEKQHGSAPSSNVSPRSAVHSNS